MGRKKKEDRDIDTRGRRGSLKEETLYTIYGIVCLVAAVFFVLAYFEKAGQAGIYAKSFLDILFGVGYILFPFVLLMQGIAFFKSVKKQFSFFQLIGSFIFLIASLGLVQTLFDEKGGLIGMAVATPLLKAFDLYATVIFLFALVVISILVMFDTHVRVYFPKLFFWRKNEDDLSDNEEDADDLKVLNAKVDKQAQAAEEDEKEEKVEKKSEVKKAKPEEEFMPVTAHKKITSTPYNPPPLSLLEKDKGKPGVGDIKGNANIIKRTLQNFGIDVEMDEVSIGPSVTRYALKPAEGVKLSRIVGLQNDLALALAAHPLRIEAPIPGKSLVGIEIPNTTKTLIGLATQLAEDEYQHSEKALLISLGKGISGKSYFSNLAKAPHLLIAGATGAGKSVTIHAIITSLLYRNSPEQLKFIMIDPKRVELTLYNNIPHLLTPVITDAKKAIMSLKWAAKEMDRRYDVLESHKVRDVESYHKNILIPALDKAKKDDTAEAPETMPYIVVVIDELADIMQAYPRELESGIVRLAQMSRAVGIHLILSTQRPSVNVITGLIKANIPSRIALQVTSQIDSRTILDTSGAEKLLGAGDMLFMSGDMAKPIRIQSSFISEQESKKVVNYLVDNYRNEVPHEIDLSAEAIADKDAIFSSSFEDGEEDDELYEEAKDVILKAGKASTSYLQRRLGVGYARAARLIDILEERGIVGPADGSKPREVLAGATVTEGPGETEQHAE